MKIGPSTDLRPIQDIQDMFHFSPSGALKFMELLQVPVIEYPCGQMFMRWAFEQALFRLHLKGTGLTEALNIHRDYSSYLPYDDKELGFMMAMSSIMYGNEEDSEFKARLKILGDQLLTGAMRDGRMWKWKKKPGIRNSKRGNVSKTVREIQHG